MTRGVVDERWRLDIGDVSQGGGVEDEQVGELAGLKTADVGRSAGAVWRCR